MSGSNQNAAEYARKLLFELQALLQVADKAGVDTERVRELLRKASVASRLGTNEGIKEMVTYLTEGRTAIEKTLVESLHRQLTDIRKEIDEKRSKLPNDHYVFMSYTNSINALNRKDYEGAVKNMIITKNELEKTLAPDIGKAYQKYYATQATPCATCQGKVKTGFVVFKCICGKTHHETCAMREGHCTCGAKF
jgi:hypothetical protein